MKNKTNKDEFNFMCIFDEFNNHLAKKILENGSEIFSLENCFDKKFLSDVKKKFNCPYNVVEVFSEHYTNIMDLLLQDIDVSDWTIERTAYEIKHNVYFQNLIQDYVLSVSFIFGGY